MSPRIGVEVALLARCTACPATATFTARYTTALYDVAREAGWRLDPEALLSHEARHACPEHWGLEGVKDPVETYCRTCGVGAGEYDERVWMPLERARDWAVEHECRVLIHYLSGANGLTGVSCNTCRVTLTPSGPSEDVEAAITRFVRRHRCETQVDVIGPGHVDVGYQKGQHWMWARPGTVTTRERVASMSAVPSRVGAT